MTVFDLEIPDWASVNADGVWCNFCGDILVAAHHAEDDSVCPESCRQCGAPDDLEAMQEYFA